MRTQRPTFIHARTRPPTRPSTHTHRHPHSTHACTHDVDVCVRIFAYRYWNWAPAICRTDFKTDTLRIELDTKSIPTWTYIDFVQVVGSKIVQTSALKTSTPISDAINGKQYRIVYVPDANTYGKDSFEYQSNDCLGDPFRSSVSGIVSFDIASVNDLPFQTQHAIDSTLGATSFVTLDFRKVVSDVETPFDQITIKITSVPAGGKIVDGTIALNAALMPHVLSSSSLRLQFASDEGLVRVPNFVTNGITQRAFEGTIGFTMLDGDGGSTNGIIILRVLDPVLMCKEPGYILFASGLDNSTCVPCGKGTYAFDSRLCVESPSNFFINETAASASSLHTCPPNTKFTELVQDDDDVLVQLRTGATSITDCTCEPGFYSAALWLPGLGVGKMFAIDAGDGKQVVRIHELAQLSSGTTCVECPEGAECRGNLLPPISLPGFGIVPSISNVSFIECGGSGRCPGATCDCLGGRFFSTNYTAYGGSGLGSVVLQPMGCGLGYLANSPLCALCEEGEEYPVQYAKTMGRCDKCEWDRGWYAVLSALVILLWFPTIAYLTEQLEALEITFGFLGFLGLYGSYGVEWPEPLNSVYQYASLFNLDIGMMQGTCASEGTSYITIWAIQTFLPLVYVATCSVHLLMSYSLFRISKTGALDWLIAHGYYMPRVSFSPTTLINLYVPQAILYMHNYFITGVSKSLEPWLCDPVYDGKSVLRVDPTLTCWEGTHLKMFGANIGAMLLYFVLVPFTYFYVLFRLVPARGLENERLKANFGFLWSRFEDRCYWWEVVEMVRKLGLVFVGSFIYGSISISVMAIICLGIVLSMNFRYGPYRRAIYDIFELAASISQIVIVLLGIILASNQASETISDTRRETDQTKIVIVVCFGLSATIVVGIWAIFGDVVRLMLDMRITTLRVAKQLAIRADTFRVDIHSVQPPSTSLLTFLLHLKDEAYLKRIRALERALKSAHRQQQQRRKLSAHDAKRQDLYQAEINADANVLDWLLDVKSAPETLSDYLDLREKYSTDDTWDSDHVFAAGCSGWLSMWLSEQATEEQRELAKNFAYDVSCFHDGAQANRGWLRRKLNNSSVDILVELFQRQMANKEAIQAAISKRGHKVLEGLRRQATAASGGVTNLSKHATASSGGVTDFMSQVTLSTEHAIADAMASTEHAIADALASTEHVIAGSVRVMRDMPCHHSEKTKKRSLTNIFNKLSNSLSKVEIANYLEEVLQVAMDTTASQMVTLVPVGASELPRLIVLDVDIEGSEKQVEDSRARLMDTLDWTALPGTAVGVCAQTRTTVRVDNALLDKRFGKRSLRTMERYELTQLCEPVFAASTTGEQLELIAVISCYNKLSPDGHRSGGRFLPEDENEIRAAADAVSRYDVELQSRHTESKVLRKFSKKALDKRLREKSSRCSIRGPSAARLNVDVVTAQKISPHSTSWC